MPNHAPLPGRRVDGVPDLDFPEQLGMFSSSKGRDPHSRAYKMTPQLHTSTSGPQYSFPEMTCHGTAA